MVKNILTVPSTVCNNSKSVLEFSLIFEHMLEYVTDDANNCEIKRDCLRSIETLIELGYKAVKEYGLKSHLNSYQKHLQNYIYHSSIYLGGKALKPYQVLDNPAQKIALSLVNILLLAEDSFAEIGYPSYYQEFMQAVNVLFASVGMNYADIISGTASLDNIPKPPRKSIQEQNND